MNLLQLAQLFEQPITEQNTTIIGAKIDSREVEPGDVFFAFKGEHVDGHDYVLAAERAGAIAMVVQQPNSEVTVPQFIVPDVHQALLQLAGAYRNSLTMPFIAVTGSCGKTTTRALLASIFAQAGNTVASEKSYNNNIGVPLTLMKVTRDAEFVITELGANHLHEIRELTALVKPKVAMITNAAPAHLEGFGSLEGVAKAKGEIFEGLGDDGVAVINADDQFAEYWQSLNKGRQMITFGVAQSADVMAKNIQFNEYVCPSFELVTEQGSTTVQLQLIGEHNVKNALAAAAAGLALNLTLEQIKTGLEQAQAEQKRLNEKPGIAGSSIIDDSYNANPLSVNAALEVLAHSKGQSTFVLGDMLELADQGPDFHAKVGAKAKALGINRLYCFGDLTQNTVTAFGDNAQHFTNRDTLITALKSHLTADTTVLIKGSNSMRMDLVVKALLELS